MQPSPANEQMVDRLICEGALWSAPVIAAFRATPRQQFLDRIFQFHRKSNRWREVITRDAGQRELELVYSDRALITHLSPADSRPQVPVSSSSQPSLMAQMLEDLHLTRGLRLLEVGAGTGYNAALLAHVLGPGRVVSVDVDGNVLSEAWDHLRAFSDRQVKLGHGDGRLGWPPDAPFDRIMVTAASADLEPAWLEQMREDGLLLAPWNLAPGLAFLVRGTVRAGIFEGHLTRPAYFLPLRAELGGQEANASDVPEFSFPPIMQQRPAPWSGWFERKTTRLRWFSFMQALVFYGWLRGLTVHYHAALTGQPMFGISDLDAVCCFDAHDWKFNGQSALELGRDLWQAFLSAGGPWPTEFRLFASPHGGLSADRPESFLRQGPRCQQLWELIVPRDRPAWF